MNEQMNQVEPNMPQDTSWLTAWREVWDAETQATKLREWRTRLIQHGLIPYAKGVLPRIDLQAGEQYPGRRLRAGRAWGRPEERLTPESQRASRDVTDWLKASTEGTFYATHLTWI